MLNDFKVYVSTLDEECLIQHTVEALLKVFPPEQIEVLDLGSKDTTVDRVPKGVKVHKLQVPAKDAGSWFTAVKNEYSAKQGWVLWVDGDEIYPTSSLLKIYEWVEAGQANLHTETGLRVYWRILKEGFCSNEYLSAGPKVFNTKVAKFHRAWPREVIINAGAESKSLFTGVWFWHGVLLTRSSTDERTARRKKRQSKEGKYDKYLTWSEEAPPWEKDYNDDIKFPWTVVNMSGTSEEELSKSWKGNELYGFDRS